MKETQQTNTWWDYLTTGLRRSRQGSADAGDRIATAGGHDTGSRNLKNIKPFVLQHWKMAVPGVLIIIATSGLTLAQPLVTRSMIDDALLAADARWLGIIMGLMVALKIVNIAFSHLQGFFFARFEQTVLLDIQESLLQRTLRFPTSFFDDKETGYLMSRLTSDVQGVRLFFSSYLVHIATSLLKLLGGLAMLFYLEWRLALISLLLIPGLGLSVRYFSAKIRALSHHGMEQQAQATRQLQESLSATQLIKAFASEDREVGRIMGQLRRAFHLSLERSAVGTLASVATSGLGDIARLAVYGFGGYQVIVGEWTLGSLFAFQAYLGHVFGPAQFLAGANLQLQPAWAALERVSALFNIMPEENLGSGAPVDHLEGRIEFRDVSFSYGDRGRVLDRVSCEIKPGEHVAIVGPSGVGKTTFVSLVLRLYRPTSGELAFDGTAASHFELGSLRQRIGYVSQATMLLAGSIFENLRYGFPDASREQVENAARVAGIHDFIVSQPAAYETEIGERGVRLSEGQKQRLSIARALVKDPDILVFDEPSSALDAETERSIFDTLPELVREKTLLVVAHRASTIRQADRVLMLQEGRLVEAASPDEVLSELSS